MKKLPVDDDGYLTEKIFDMTPRRRSRYSNTLRLALIGMPGAFIDWAERRYGVKLSRLAEDVLLGLDECDDTYFVDGLHIKLRTPRGSPEWSKLGQSKQSDHLVLSASSSSPGGGVAAARLREVGEMCCCGTI